MYVLANPQSALVLSGRTPSAYRGRPATLYGRRSNPRRRNTLGSTESALIGGGSTAASIGTTALLTSFTSIGAAAGPIGAAVGAAIGLVAGLFTGHHAQAEATEANTLNQAIPIFINTVQQIMAALNAGQITPTAAISALQQAQSTYYSAVSGIIKKSSACATTCTTGAADGGMTPRCCNTGSSCNAACCNGCVAVEYTVNGLTKVIQAGGGNFTIPGTGQNGEIQGSPAVTVSYNGAQGGGGVGGALQSAIGGTMFGLPAMYVLGGGALFLLLILMRR